MVRESVRTVGGVMSKFILDKGMRKLRSSSFISEDSTMVSVPYKTAINVLSNFSNNKNKQMQEVINRLEDYPCCMSCYLTQDEWRAAKNMKEVLIGLLKERLLDEN